MPQFDKMMELNAAFDDYDRRFHTLLEPKKRTQSLQKIEDRRFTDKDFVYVRFN